MVIAAGARPEFFGVTGPRRERFPALLGPDAARLRLHLQRLLNVAGDPAGEARQLRIVVVGGGPTGVETAGTLAELLAALAGADRLAGWEGTLVDRGVSRLALLSDRDTRRQPDPAAHSPPPRPVGRPDEPSTAEALSPPAQITVLVTISVYAIGDTANIPGPDGLVLPQLGSVAQQAVGGPRRTFCASYAETAGTVPLQGQGDHGEDRPQRSRR